MSLLQALFYHRWTFCQIRFGLQYIFANFNNNLSDNLLLANIDALAFIEGGGGSEVKCSTTDITEVTSIRQGNTLVKVSECRTCSCNFGSGGSCEEGQECVYYSGPFAGQSSGSITSIYCY